MQASARRSLRVRAFPALLIALIAGLLTSACRDPAENGEEAGSASDEYVVERATAAGVEVVRSISGSRWGGEGRLEQELSIGEEIGDDVYLFEDITAAWATDDRIYVVDAQVPAVRAYDHAGTYLFTVGGPGQGPGEYSRPAGMAVASDGRIVVTDLQGARLGVFGPDGKPIEDWSLGSPQSAMGLVLTDDDELFTRIIELPEDLGSGGPVELRMGMQAVGPEGLRGEPIFPPPTDYEPPSASIAVGGRRMRMAAVPFTPGYEWIMTPGGEIVAGVGDTYRFEIHAADGKVTAVEKYWDPVAVDPAELPFRSEMASAGLRRMSPDLSVPESEIPSTKPAFTDFRADRSGRLWVARQGPSRPDPDCTEMGGGGGGGGGIMITRSIGPGGGGTDVRLAPSSGGSDEIDYNGDCWANTWLFDLFELSTGEFLGTVPAPEPGFRIPLFVDGDLVLAAVTDGTGITRLKRYRLVTG